MSSTILQAQGNPRAEPPAGDAPDTASDDAATKNPFLVALGERTRSLRSRRGMTRKARGRGGGRVGAAPRQPGIRHVGNASILVLLHVARALQCSLAELIGDVTTTSPEWLMLRELLENRDDATLRRVRVAVGEMLGTGGANASAAAAQLAGGADGPARRRQVHAGRRCWPTTWAFPSSS
jgi:XRE family aerobic/anaerobic benzoate catabolism transcriptional regulator